MPAPKLNQNARKDSSETTWLQVRCHPTAKAAWVAAAGGTRKLSRWVKQTLNKAVSEKENENAI